jgi:hypothetical protein
VQLETVEIQIRDSNDLFNDVVSQTAAAGREILVEDRDRTKSRAERARQSLSERRQYLAEVHRRWVNYETSRLQISEWIQLAEQRLQDATQCETALEQLQQRKVIVKVLSCAWIIQFKRISSTFCSCLEFNCTLNYPCKWRAVMAQECKTVIRDYKRNSECQHSSDYSGHRYE